MTKQTDVLKTLNSILLESLNHKEGYKNGFQKWLEIFVDNYENKLNKNSLPLLDFFKRLDNVEKVKIREYLLKATSLKALNITDKGVKLTFKDGYESFIITDKILKWYEIKLEVKPFEPTDEKLKKSLMNLLKHYEKQAIKDILNTL